MQGRGWRAFSDGGQLFRMPEGLAFDAQARLLAVTTDGDYALFRQPSHDDARVRSWRRYTAQDVRPLPGFRDLSSVAVDAGGFIYVTDPTNDRVVRINPDLSGGTPFGTFGQEGRHFFVPLGLTVAHDGHVVVVDCGNHRVVAFKPEASKWNFPASWWSLGHAGPGEFEFLAPTFVTLWRPRGE
ncbi:MAG: hypothetical protein FJX76_27720 [Armatimonadetes bacterium]|nr:hypothetical protein [Armatimonadota bacterium]